MKKIIVLAACLAVTATGALAQEKPARPAPGAMFAKLDTDGDGKISKEEAQKSERKRLAENFDAIDTNKDGFLEKEELKAFREKMQASRHADHE